MAEEEKVSYQERKDALKASASRGIQKVFRGENLPDFLKTLSRFHRYSVNNNVLIYLQNKDATDLRTFGDWKTAGVRVKRFQRGTQLLVPSSYSKEVEQTKLDPRTHTPVLDENDDMVVETVSKELRGYRIETYFDIAQTTADPMDAVPGTEIDPGQYALFAAALEQASPEQLQGITERDGSPDLTVMVQEIARIVCENQTQKYQPEKDQPTLALEVASIAHTVCLHYGLESPARFDGVAEWAENREPAELKNTLSNIRGSVHRMIYFIDRSFAELQQEQQIGGPEVAVEAPIREQEPLQQAPVQMTAIERDLTDPEESCFAVFQLRLEPTTAKYLYVESQKLEEWGDPILFENYELKHMDSLPEFGTTERKLNDLQREFGQRLPGQDSGIKVSDVIVLNEYGKTSSWYRNNGAFAKLEGFLPVERAALAAQRGGQTEQLSINGGQERTSVLSQLDAFRSEGTQDAGRKITERAAR